MLSGFYSVCTEAVLTPDDQAAVAPAHTHRRMVQACWSNWPLEHLQRVRRTCMFYLKRAVK